MKHSKIFQICRHDEFCLDEPGLTSCTDLSCFLTVHPLYKHPQTCFLMWNALLWFTQALQSHSLRCCGPGKCSFLSSFLTQFDVLLAGSWSLLLGQQQIAVPCSDPVYFKVCEHKCWPSWWSSWSRPSLRCCGPGTSYCLVSWILQIPV